MIVTVALSSAPSAATHGSSRASRIGSGVKPRARRRNAGAPATTRTTLSSARVTIARSWSATASAMPARRASPPSMTIGSPDTLAEVATSASELARDHPIVAGRPAEQLPQHQPLQRRIGQEQPDGRQPVADAGREAHRVAQRRDHDRAGAILEQAGGELVEPGEAARRRRVRHHHGERLAVAALARRAADRPRRRAARRRRDGSRRGP